MKVFLHIKIYVQKSQYLKEKGLCPDGSCLPKNVICPSKIGCPVDIPFRPIKYFEGIYVPTLNFVFIEREIDSIGNVICSDETEAPSYEECKPLIVCSYDEVNCDDVIKQRLVLMKK